MKTSISMLIPLTKFILKNVKIGIMLYKNNPTSALCYKCEWSFRENEYILLYEYRGNHESKLDYIEVNRIAKRNDYDKYFVLLPRLFSSVLCHSANCSSFGLTVSVGNRLNFQRLVIIRTWSRDLLKPCAHIPSGCIRISSNELRSDCVVIEVYLIRRCTKFVKIMFQTLSERKHTYIPLVTIKSLLPFNIIYFDRLATINILSSLLFITVDK